MLSLQSLIKRKKVRRKIENLIRQAKKLGHPVEFSRSVTNCDGSVSKCSTDLIRNLRR